MTKGSGDERSPVAPVTFRRPSSAGMAVFQICSVLEADASPMACRTALQLINRFPPRMISTPTPNSAHWFEQHGWTESVFGEADVLARSKSTSVDAMKEAGVLRRAAVSASPQWAEYSYPIGTPHRRPHAVWKHCTAIRRLKQGGDSALWRAPRRPRGKAEAVRQLAYRLYTLCDASARPKTPRL